MLTSPPLIENDQKITELKLKSALLKQSFKITSTVPIPHDVPPDTQRAKYLHKKIFFFIQKVREGLKKNGGKCDHFPSWPPPPYCDPS